MVSVPPLSVPVPFFPSKFLVSLPLSGSLAPRAPAAAPQAVVEDDEIQEYVPVKSEPAAQQQEIYEDPSQGAAAGG